jgi:translation initiation factor 3 subunit B
VVGFQVDTGFWIWSFQGKILKRLNIEKFCGLQWRPRLQTLLTPKQQQEIRKNLKKYSSQFESKDRMRLSRASKVSAEDVLVLCVYFDGISYCCLLIKGK